MGVLLPTTTVHVSTPTTASLDAHRHPIAGPPEVRGPYPAYPRPVSAREVARGQVGAWTVYVDPEAAPIVAGSSELVAEDGTRYRVHGAELSDSVQADLAVLVVDADVVDQTVPVIQPMEPQHVQANLVPAAWRFAGDANGDGLADHWSLFGGLGVALVDAVQVAAGHPGTEALLCDLFPAPPGGGPFVFRVQVKLPTPGGGAVLVWEYHDDAGVDPLAYDYTPPLAAAADWTDLAGASVAPPGTTQLRMKVELRDGAVAELRAPLAQQGSEVMP